MISNVKNIFRDLFYELVGHYEYNFARRIDEELKYKEGGQKIIQSGSVIDPLYGEINLPDYIRYLTFIPIVSRLSEIRQLAHTYLFLPGASHTRLEHSLGVMYRSKKILDRVKNDNLIPNITDDDYIIVQIASLLHDLGHPAWGHSLDGITGYVVHLLKELGDFPSFPRKLDIAISIYLILYNDQLKKAIDGCFQELKDLRNKIDTERFRKVIAQIIAEEENPIFDELDDSIMKKVHYLTTIIGSYRGKRKIGDNEYRDKVGIDTDRLDWIIRDSHHAAIDKKLDPDTRKDFEKFRKKNIEDDFEIRPIKGEFLTISGEFINVMDGLRETIYSLVYEGLERSFIDSLLTRLAYAVILVLDNIGETIASPTTKARSVMGYLLMQDFLLKEYTNKVLSIAEDYAHILIEDEHTRNFVKKSGNLLRIVGYIPYIADLLKDPSPVTATVSTVFGGIDLRFERINLPALNKAILILSASAVADIFELIMNFRQMKNEDLLIFFKNMMTGARVDMFQVFNIYTLEYEMQSDIESRINEADLYVLLNYYFFRKIDDEFKNIKRADEFYKSLRRNLTKTPMGFILFDRILAESEWKKVYDPIFASVCNQIRRMLGETFNVTIQS